MNQRFRPWALALLAAASLFTASAKAEDSASVDKELVEKLAPMVEKAMIAYNEGDAKAFWADFTKSMPEVTSEVVFDGLYKNNFFPKFGKYTPESKELIPADSSALKESEVLLLIYTAKFEKGDADGKAKIAVNLIKEGEEYRLMQLQIADTKGAGE